MKQQFIHVAISVPRASHLDTDKVTRFQFVTECKLSNEGALAVVQYALAHRLEVKMTYSTKPLVREDDEMARVSKIMQEVL